VPPILYVVIREHGASWDASRPLEEQELWQEHADFMEGLVDDGFVVLGGPLGDGDRAMLVVRADSVDAIHATLAADPWSDSGHLWTGSIEPWTIRLDAGRA
jgi:uncharacterized protein YciI